MPVTPQTPFYIASVSKALTALAVMRVVEAGRLGLDEQLGSLIPGLVEEGSETAAISVRDLLGHTSGWSERDGSLNQVDPDLAPDALERNARRIVTTALNHSIGEFEYSNANYDLLGYLIEEASGESYRDYMRSRVFAPLEMVNSFASEEDSLKAGVATGHYPFFGVVRPHPTLFVPGSVPSAFLSSSAEDLGHFLIAHLNMGRFRNQTAFSPEGMAALHRPITYPDPCCGYAMGLWIVPLQNAGHLVDGSSGISEYQVPVIYEHYGDHSSYASSILMLPKERIGVVVLLNVNDQSVSLRYHQMHLGIASILLGEPPPPTTPYEDAIHRYAKILALGLVGLFLVRTAVSTRRLRRLRKLSPGRSFKTTTVLRYIALPLVVDTLLLGASWWFLADQSDAPLTLVRRSVPDIFLAMVAATVVGLGWGLLRSLIALRALARSEPRQT